MENNRQTQAGQKHKHVSSIDGFLKPRIPKINVYRSAPVQPRPVQSTLAVNRTAQNQMPPSTLNKNYRLYPIAAVSRTSLRSTRSKTKSWKKYLLRGSLATVALFLIGGGWVGFKFYRNVAKITHNNNPFNLVSVFRPVPLKNQNNQVNILVAADSADRKDGGGGGDLTDSIMILSVNTQTHVADMISVPRDLWVDIPGWSHQKINAANVVTSFSQAGYPQGGMGKLEKVINDNLGVPIDYYALVNYTAFKDLVNALGGIDVTIQSPDSRGLYDPSPDPVSHTKLLKLPNGQVTLDGQTALALARARGDNAYSYGFPASDFDRTLHQRWMALAIKDKATNSSVISNPLKIGQLADAIGNNVKTDLKLNEIETLYSLTKSINNQNIKSYNINTLVAGKNLLKSYLTPSGQDALIPAAGLDDFSQIQTALNNLLSNTPVQQEVASVVVLNGSSVSGVATKNAANLTKQGMHVTTIANAPKLVATTTIIDNSKGLMTLTKQSLESLFGTTSSVDAQLSGLYPDAQFIIVIGTDRSQ